MNNFTVPMWVAILTILAVFACILLRRTERPRKRPNIKCASKQDRMNYQIRRNVERMEEYEESRRDYVGGLEYTEKTPFFMWHL